MSNRRSLELKPVPEYNKLSTTGLGPEPPQRSTPASRGGGLSARRDGGAGSGSLASASRYQRNASSRQMGGLGRTSIVVKLQRHIIDMSRLQANWLSNTLVKRSEAQDYVNEEDQGFVALLARHVDIPGKAWGELQVSMGGTDGQFWQSGYAPGEANHNPLLATQQDKDQEHDQDQDPFAAEEGKAQEPVERKPRRSVFGMPLIQPYNLFAVLWTMSILLLDLTYTAFWVPMNVAFCTAEYGNLSSGCTSSDLVGGLLYVLNVLLGFQIGVVATNGIRKRTVVDGRLVSWLYFRYGRFWLDFVASVPFVYLVVVLAGQSRFQLNKSWVNCLSLLRLLRMVRVVSITKVVYMDSLSGRFQDSALARRLSVTVIYSIFLAYQLAVAINLFACIMVLCAYFQGYTNSWMTAVDWVNLPEASPVYQWYCAVYWMIVTATTTGFGDFQPRSIAEQVVANVAMLGGMIMFGVLVASIGNLLSRATTEAHQAYANRRKIMHVMDWAQHRTLPPEIRKQVQNFYADKYGHTVEEAADEEFMGVLPSRLRAKVATSMCKPLVEEVHIFTELESNVQSLLAENMKPLRLPAGADLCQQGDVANSMWILQEGVVQAVRYKEASETIDSTEQPCLLGESALLHDAVESCRVRPWTLSTVTPCRLWGITLAELSPLMRMYPAIAVLAAEYVKVKTVGLLYGNSLVEDGHWCELAAVIVKQLQEHADHEEAQELIREMTKTSAFDDSFQPVLDKVLTFCATRRGAVVPEEGITSAPRRSTLSPAASHLKDISDAPEPEHLQQAPPHPPPQPPPQHQHATAFGTPAAAAALSAALQAATSNGPYELQQLQQPGAATDAQLSALAGAPPSSGQLRGFSAAGSAAPAATGLAVGPGAACPGCQRCVCPSCGQGMDPGGPQLGGGATAAAAVNAAAGATAISLMQQGANAKPTAGPAVRAWGSRPGALRRLSIGVRSDQVWAVDRRSIEWRQLGAVSVMSVYE